MAALPGGKDVLLVVYTEELRELGPHGLRPFLAAASRPMLWFKNRTEIESLEQCAARVSFISMIEYCLSASRAQCWLKKARRRRKNNTMHAA